MGAVKNILSRYSSGPEEGTKTVEVRDCHSGLEIFAGLLRIDDFLYFAGIWNVQSLSGADYALVTGRGGDLWGLILTREGKFKPEGAVDIICETFRFGITALSFLFRKLLWEIQQLFKGPRHDNRAQLVEGERSYFTPGAVYIDN